MQRYIKQQLIEWTNSYNRKPLVLRGARQVGKTYILKEFGEEHYEGVAYFNFDHDEPLKELFANTKDPKKNIRTACIRYRKSYKARKNTNNF